MTITETSTARGMTAEETAELRAAIHELRDMFNGLRAAIEEYVAQSERKEAGR